MEISHSSFFIISIRLLVSGWENRRHLWVSISTIYKSIFFIFHCYNLEVYNFHFHYLEIQIHEIPLVYMLLTLIFCFNRNIPLPPFTIKNKYIFLNSQKPHQIAKVCVKFHFWKINSYFNFNIFEFKKKTFLKIIN